MIKRNKFSKREILELIASWLTISVAFSIVLSEMNLVGFISILPLSLIVVGTGFVFHELAHRFAANYYGAHAEYRAWGTGLWIALISSLFGFIFAAPGAVYFAGERINAKKQAVISAAGPLTNLLVALGFLLLIPSSNIFLANLGRYGFQINVFLAAFNLLPIYPLDGSKIFRYNTYAWLVVFLFALFLMLSSGF